MNFFEGIVQKLGEEVGLYDKTTEDGEFGQQEKLAEATREATTKLLKEITPPQPTDLLGLGGNKKMEEERAGEVLVRCGANLEQFDKHKSLYGAALVVLGEGLKRIGLEHADLDNRVMTATVEPVKSYSEGQLKELSSLKKRFDSNRLEYDAARRTAETKKNSENDEKCRRARERYEESRTAYWNRLIHSQDRENEQASQLQAYAAAQAVYHRRCAEVWEEMARSLSQVAQTPAARPVFAAPALPAYAAAFSDVGHSPGPAPALPAGPSHGGLLPPGPSSQHSQYPPQHSQHPPQLPPQLPPAHPSRGPQVPSPREQQPPTNRGGMAGGSGMGIPPMSGGGPVSGRGGRGLPVPPPRGGRGGSGIQQPMRGGGGSAGPGGGGARPLPTVSGGGGGGASRGIGRCRAVYDFVAESSSELPLKAGDVVTVLTHVNAEWWEGELRGQMGIFPVSYVEPLP
eukprot:TRINITY_DN9486_c0_g1_i1.p1 TRINITY_DN9486_c0_g1~~TRINITY_DN9486_c0_g1_i1.p1  ORF type:complete len:457 (-),score=85.75 TRINITY_DN9486_c0_g1_i1:53-1423(-)